MVICPECESDLDIEEDEVDEGEIVSCPECGSDFEVVAGVSAGDELVVRGPDNLREGQKVEIRP